MAAVSYGQIGSGSGSDWEWFRVRLRAVPERIRSDSGAVLERFRDVIQ